MLSAVTGSGHLQVGIYTGDMRLSEGLRQGRQPALWLPFESVVTPQSLAAVAGAYADHYVRVLRDRYLGDHRTVTTLDRFRERHHGIFTGSINRVSIQGSVTAVVAVLTRDGQSSQVGG